MWQMLPILLLLTACETDSYEGFKEKGKKSVQHLIEELKKIRTKDQLIQHRQELEAYFNQIADLHKRVESYASSHPNEEIPPLTDQDHELSNQLRIEILRMYRLEGGKEIIDSCRKNL